MVVCFFGLVHSLLLLELKIISPSCPMSIAPRPCRMRDMDKDYTDAEIEEVMDVVDLTGSGDICFEEFCKVFIANIKTSASI